jgi:5-methylcytosine-specific restriction endonuclease McrA
MTLKQCRLCGVAKPHSEYSPDRRQRSGLQAWCKPCRSAKQKQYDQPWRDEHNAAVATARAERIGAATEKNCPGCGKQKPLAEFSLNPKMVLGRESRCKVCRAKAHANWCERNAEKLSERNRRLYAANREAELAGAKARYQSYVADPERKAVIRDRGRKSTAKCRAANPAKWNERAKAWRKAHPEKMRIAWSRKRAKRAAVPSDFTEAQWLEILEIHDHRCAYCLRKLTAPTKDHVIAITRGGHDTASNIVPACQSCNSRKHSRPVFAMVSTPIQFDAVA